MTTQTSDNSANALVNGQITDSMNQVLTTLLGQSTAYSFGLIDTVMSDTLGMTMHNAVTAQQNQQIIANAALSAACAQMLKAKATVSAPPVNVTSNPVGPSNNNQDPDATDLTNLMFTKGQIGDIHSESDSINTDTTKANQYVGDLIADLHDSGEDQENARQNLEALRQQIDQALGNK